MGVKYRGNSSTYYESTERGVWRYQRGNQNTYIEEEQTTQWPNEKVQKDKQRSTKQTHKTKDWVTLAPLKTGDELSCSTSGTRRVKLVTNPVISREWGKDREVFTTSGSYPWSIVTDIPKQSTKPWWRPYNFRSDDWTQSIQPK